MGQQLAYLCLCNAVNGRVGLGTQLYEFVIYVMFLPYHI